MESPSPQSMTPEQLRDAWEKQWNVQLQTTHKRSFLKHEMVQRILTFSQEEIMAALPQSKKLAVVELTLWSNQKDRTWQKISKSEDCPACGYAEKNCNC